MAEPVVKRRILTKVRRQFLHKHPVEDDHGFQYANLVATPEQLNEDNIQLLEPSVALVVNNRTIKSGCQFLNCNFRVSSIRVQLQMSFKTVTIDVQRNGMDILPWQYCAKRLESYGDLGLATWASKLKAYHEDYAKLVTAYDNVYNSNNPVICAALAIGKARAMVACRELDMKYVVKATIHVKRDIMLPVKFSYSEQILNDMGYDAESFVEWIKENGIPSIFGGDSPIHLKIVQGYFNLADYKQAFFSDGPELDICFYNKEGEKKDIKVKMSYSLEVAPDGFFISLYVLKRDNKKDCNDNIPACKQVRKERSDISGEDNDIKVNIEDHSDCDSDSI